jgi:hypothetical protein
MNYYHINITTTKNINNQKYGKYSESLFFLFIYGKWVDHIKTHMAQKENEYNKLKSAKT